MCILNKNPVIYLRKQQLIWGYSKWERVAHCSVFAEQNLKMSGFSAYNSETTNTPPPKKKQKREEFFKMSKDKENGMRFYVLQFRLRLCY